MRVFSSPVLFRFLLAFAVVPLASAENLPNTTRLLRFPTTNGQQIVFCYGGELYTVAKDGGVARRLTSGPGYTSFPRFSADGTQLAFTSQYDGNTEVYVMPSGRWRAQATNHFSDTRPRRYLGPNGTKQSGHDLGKYQAAGRLPVAHEVVQRFHRPAVHRGT